MATIKDLYLGQSIIEEIDTTPKRWWDDDGDGIGYEPGEVDGKFKKKKKKKKKVEEGYSDWREELFEASKKEKVDKEEQIKEMPSGKTNSITIGPEIKETIEELGGTLIEMVEYDELEYAVESVYYELLDEGYDEEDIEESLNYAIYEARVTFGHDTKKPKAGLKKTVAAVGRLARTKLKSKAKEVKSKFNKMMVSGARKIASKASKFADKYDTPKTGVRSSKRYRGSGVGRVERVSSGDYTPPKSSSPKTSQSSPDPWEGSYTKSSATPTPTSKPQSSGRQKLASDLRRKIKQKKSSRLNVSRSKTTKNLDDLLASIRNEEYDLHEREMTSGDKAKEDKLKKKFDDSQMKQNMIDQYGKEEGTQIYFAKIRKMAMEDYELEEAKLSRTEKREKSAGKKKGRSKTMHLVDLDANAMKPKKKGVEAKIGVKSGGKTTKELDPQQFNHYKFKDDEKPDFSQFRSSKIFKKTLKGNKHVRNLHRGGEASGLTARGGMDNNREVKSHVKASGFNKKHGVNFKGVHFTGDVPGKGTDDKKMKVIKNLIKAKKPKTIKFSDDHAKNLSAPEKFNSEEGKDKTENRGSSTPKIKTYLTRSDGRPKRFGSGGGGIRDPKAVNKPSSPKENQRRRAKARRGMSEGVVDIEPKSNSSSNKRERKDQLKLVLLRQKELEHQKRMLKQPSR